MNKEATLKDLNTICKSHDSCDSCPLENLKSCDPRYSSTKEQFDALNEAVIRHRGKTNREKILEIFPNANFNGMCPAFLNGEDLSCCDISDCERCEREFLDAMWEVENAARD